VNFGKWVCGVDSLGCGALGCDVLELSFVVQLCSPFACLCDASCQLGTMRALVNFCVSPSATVGIFPTVFWLGCRFDFQSLMNAVDVDFYSGCRALAKMLTYIRYLFYSSI
jgi:hypothetical protein